MFLNKQWQYKFLRWTIWRYNIDISDHPDLDQPKYL